MFAKLIKSYIMQTDLLILEIRRTINMNMLWRVILSTFLFCLSVQANEDVLPADRILPPPPPPPSDIITQDKTVPAANVTIQKNASLTDNIKNNSSVVSEKDDSIVNLPDIGEAIVGKITDIEKKTKEGTKSAGETLADMIDKNRKSSANGGGASIKRSNAAVFDISGAMLRMTPAQIDAALTKRGYKRTVQKLDIPNFIRWRNEEKCRAQGVVGYERLANCVVVMAKKDNHQFIERVFYSKYDSQEDMEIRFTSNFTQNKAYHINYKSGVLTNMRGNSQKEFYLRKIKIYDFWKKINQKYGVPDNKDNVIWGLGGNKPYLQAGTGRLRLEDIALRDLDYTRMSREDKKYMHTGLYNF